jgi:hypothetical protein
VLTDVLLTEVLLDVLTDVLLLDVEGELLDELKTNELKLNGDVELLLVLLVNPKLVIRPELLLESSQNSSNTPVTATPSHSTDPLIPDMFASLKIIVVGDPTVALPDATSFPSLSS